MSQTTVQIILLSILMAIFGCEGRSLVDDNPVFTAAPPRRSYTNSSTIVAAQDPKSASGTFQQISHTSSTLDLKGNTIVAEVNGQPIFVDDLVGSIRVTIEADPNVSAHQRNEILMAQIKQRLDAYIDQEVVLQAFNAAIPAERHAVIEESLEEPFQGVLADIKARNQLTTDEELENLLNSQGLSIDLLRETFLRSQKVQGYLSTLAQAPEVIDRLELLEYYHNHLDEFTKDDRVRWQEIVVEFDAHGGETQAKSMMQQAISELQNGADFADVAVKYSDALSAEKRGDKGWLESGSLVDTDLEARLFRMKPTEITEVITRDDRFEIFRVLDRQYRTTQEFSDVQSMIERKLKQQKLVDSRKKQMEEMKAKANITTMLDDK